VADPGTAIRIRDVDVAKKAASAREARRYIAAREARLRA